MMQTVKLSRLRLSDINVRKSGDLSIDQLAADIDARGVLQNLLVTPVAKPRGHFAVFDGGRRFRALTLLAERGTIAADAYEVPVLVLKGDDATLSETSLAANFQQLRLTPAEECRAFQHFLGQDGDIEAVARRFGITRRFVEGRLRLASLADPIFNALEAGEITLDAAKAYASTENRDKQLLIWDAYSGHGYINADTIRRAIANETMKATDPVALLVGESAYRAAGGIVDADLFSEGGDRWVNPEIAQRLAAEIMEAAARRIGEDTGLGWIRPIASSQTYNASAGLHRVSLLLEPLTPEQQERLEAIDGRLEIISGDMEDEALDEGAYDTLAAEVETLEAERQAIGGVGRRRVVPDELKPLVGAFLTLSHKGELVLDSEYYSEAPIARGRSGEDGDEGGVTTRPSSGDGGALAPRPEAVAPGGKPLSARLYDELAMQRRDVLAACLLAHPALALDYALFAMIDARHHSGSYGTTIRARRPDDPSVGAQPATRAQAYLADALDGLDGSWTEAADVVDRFEAFRALDDDSKAAWLAHVVAASLEARAGYGVVRQDRLQNRLASLMDVDVARWWRPTSENFFDRVDKAALLTLLGEVGGAQLAARYAASKKSEISTSCQSLFAGEAIVEAEVKERALAWVPNAMRFLDAACPDAEEERFADDGDDGPGDDGDAAADCDADAPAEAEESVQEALAA